MNITAVILTRNESLHLERCLNSILKITDKIVIVDCYSTDNTLHIAQSYNATILQREWTNHSDQFNWALSQLPIETEWVLRIDSDEYLTTALINEISNKLPMIKNEITGIYLKRRMTFQSKLINHGGIFPVKILRLFRFGHGMCENRLMDEHIVVNGKTTSLSAEFIDDNLNSLRWWTDKHNKYSDLEAVELLNREFHFMSIGSNIMLENGSQVFVKRWLKDNIYLRIPSGLRAFLYFVYRYVIRFGFLDGQRGTAFHVLQGFWYRYLVDLKVKEVKRYMNSQQVDVKAAINAVLGIKI